MKFKDFIKWMSDIDYRNFPGFSQSILKGLADDGPSSLLDKKEIKSIALEFGSLVDIIITDPENRDNIFYTNPIEKPTASLLVLADELLKDHYALDYTYEQITDKEYVIEKIKNLGLWSKSKDDNLLSKFDNDLFYTYIYSVIDAEGKIICTPTLVEAAEHCADVLLTHSYTKELFNETDDIEVLKQVPVFYKFNGEEGKGKIDLLRIDHKKKLISIYDIKTGSELPSNFENSFYFFKYYLQVISYILGVQYMIETIPELKEYSIDKFRFIYISKKLPDTPCIYEVNEELLHSFLDGWIDGTGRYNKGFIQLVDEYSFYIKNGIYNTEKKILDNNGILNITLS